jgi:hypothetical protein
MKKKFQIVLLMLVLLFATSANAAPMAYSVNSDSGNPATEDSLYQIDLATGVETRIGELRTGIPDDTRIDTEGLAMAPDGTLWGVDDASRTLFKINAGGFVQSPEIPLASFPTQPLNLGGHDFGLTFSCDNNLYIVSVQTRTLHNLKFDGSSEIIGASGALGQNISAIAAYGNPTLLYGLGNGTLENGTTDSPNLYSIDVNTGVAKIIGPLGPKASDYDQAGLAFDSEGTLWAITDRRTINDEKAANEPSEILRIDIGTGSATHVWTTTEIGFESLAIAPPAACNITQLTDDGYQGPGDQAIPTLSSAGRLLAVFIMLLAGMAVLRRRLL